MADQGFDAVVIGGGNKALVTAMYLAKYGKLKVGVFEERHELGGGLSTHEAPAPGFCSNTHASTLSYWYYLPLQRDFPDIEEKGLKLRNMDCGVGIILKEDQSCLPIYHPGIDPDGERTAKAVTRFAGPRDGETWWKMYQAVGPGGGFREAWLAETFNLPPIDGQPGHLERWFADEANRPGSLVSKWFMALPANYAVKDLWEHPGMQYHFLRLAKGWGIATEAAGGGMLFFVPFHHLDMAFLEGGTHSAAHACARILLENGGKFFTKSRADKIMIENQKVKGIRLADGTEVDAKMVVSGVDPHQLCFDLVGADLLTPASTKRIANLERSLHCINWYTWALHEAPDYKAADFNPDINRTHWIVLGSRDVQYLIDEAYTRRLGQIPTGTDIVNFHHHSRLDKTQSPEGKHIIGAEMHTVDATRLTERQWMEYKKVFAEQTMETWQGYMRNMSWDNVIGYDSITPYDTARRQRNMSPYGDINVIDRVPGQSFPYIPCSEWADHRIRPIGGLYGTGGAWGVIAAGSAAAGYTCYKAIAEDFGLAKTWEGQPW